MRTAYKPKFQESMIPHLPPITSIAPFKALDALPTVHFNAETNTVYLTGKYDKHMGLKDHVASPDLPLIIDGQNQTLFKNRMSIQDCKNIVIKNLEVHGGMELNNSYVEKGLENITFENVTGKWSYDRGLFLGCYTAKNLKFYKCHFSHNLFGTHIVYISGGHWSKSPGPVKGVHFIECEFDTNPAGRFALQFNGEIAEVQVSRCIFRNAQLGGISCIGVQGGVFERNISFGHNRGAGLTAYDYASHWGSSYNYFESQSDIDDFCSHHWPNQDLLIQNNTFIVGPTPFSVDAYHNDDPRKNHPGILINNAVHSGFEMWNGEQKKTIQHPGFHFPSKNIVLADNIIHGPSLNLLDIYNEHEAMETKLIKNVVWSTKPGLPFIGQCGKVGYVDRSTQYKDPQFKKLPEYPFINLMENPDYDWNDFNCEYDLSPETSGMIGRGAIA